MAGESPTIQVLAVLIFYKVMTLTISQHQVFFRYPLLELLLLAQISKDATWTR